MQNTGLTISHSDDQKTLAEAPVVEELDDFPDRLSLLKRFADLEGVILFESAMNRDSLSRYSFLTADPFYQKIVQNVQCGEDPFSEIKKQVNQFSVKTTAELPSFQGGCAGFLGYEAGNAWEKLSNNLIDEFKTPDLSIGIYDWVISWDHQKQKCWIISQGFPETDFKRRQVRAEERLKFIKERINSNLPQEERPSTVLKTDKILSEQLATQWDVPVLKGLTTNISRGDYLQKVERVIEYILAGDIFQANLSQRLLYPLNENPVDLYSRLRECNPAPFAGYYSQQDWAILSASPERFMDVDQGKVSTRPIKGTRHRKSGPEADLFTRDELRESVKDRAENVMIVDLLRNDLSRVCLPHSVHVPELCKVESYETVQHLVSEIRGTLRPDLDVWDLLRASFPGGSITGAPNVRSMQIIAELEPTVRGPYCGSLFYLGFDGRMDSNILIRTFTCRKGWIQCPVGGGITAQSDPEKEYQETMDKAEGMLRALR